jgi:DNA-binding GntR family transcriptional regulator
MLFGFDAAEMQRSRRSGGLGLAGCVNEERQDSTRGHHQAVNQIERSDTEQVS